VAKTPGIAFGNETYDGQFQRTLLASYAGMADLGEAFATARQVGKPDPDRWYNAWFGRAESVRETAEAAEAAGHRESARGAYLRSAEYYRQSYFFLRRDLNDPSLQRAYAAQVASFTAALPLMDLPVETLAVPYAGTTLKAYFFAPDDAGAPRPTVVATCGYDSTAEEGLVYLTGALERGYNAVVFEGPGQGAALYRDRLWMRPDFEVVLTPVIDLIAARPDVRADALVLVGRSFGGYLAPRAAAFEHRVAALVCDPAQPDMGARVPAGVAGKVAPAVVAAQMKASVDRREFFGARMAVHGLSRISDYFAELRRYTLLDVADRITCPTLVVECEGDFVGGGGSALVEAMTKAKSTLVNLTAVQGAGGHCGGLGQRVWNQVVYDWLGTVLDPV
jgi:pimeloyl-ACP methyl ester carboxylesterase